MPRPTRESGVSQPSHFYEGIQGQSFVHIMGTDPHDQADAVTYGTLPDLRHGRTMWAADLTGLQVTGNLTRRARDAGISVFDWPNYSPKELVGLHTKKDAAQLITAAANQDSSTELARAQQTHLRRLFGFIEGDTPNLAKGYNAIGVALRASPDLRLEDKESKLSGEELERIRRLYGTDDAREQGRTVLGPLHEVVEDLLQDNSGAPPVSLPQGSGNEVLFSYGVGPESQHFGAKKRLLVAHFATRLTQPVSTVPIPDEVLVAGAEDAAGSLSTIQMQSRIRGIGTFFVFGGITDTTKEVFGLHRAARGSTGGFTEYEAKDASIAFGNDWHDREAKSSTSGSREATATPSSTTTKTSEYTANVYPSEHTRVAPGRIILQVGRNTMHLPLAPGMA